MGWWNGTADGASLQTEDTGIIWGDSVADTLDAAIAVIVADFQASIGRKPTKVELRAGLEFSLGSYEED